MKIIIERDIEMTYRETISILELINIDMEFIDLISFEKTNNGMSLNVIIDINLPLSFDEISQMTELIKMDIKYVKSIKFEK